VAPAPSPAERELPSPVHVPSLAIPSPASAPMASPSAVSPHPGSKQPPLAARKPQPPVPATPPAPAAPAPPPPPPPSAPTSPPPPPSGLAASLAAKGQSLKVTESIKGKPSNSQSDLLQQIRSGISLKAGQQEIVEKNKEAAVDNSVGAILARRIALADSDSEEEESEEEWSD